MRQHQACKNDAGIGILGNDMRLIQHAFGVRALPVKKAVQPEAQIGHLHISFVNAMGKASPASAS